jgi:hypothetical protein
MYAQREALMDALDVKPSVQANSTADACIAGASRNVENLCQRFFYPYIATKTFSWPNEQRARVGRLWLDRNELLSITSITSGGVTIPPGNVFLEPNNYGPPYSSIELNLSTSSVFTAGSTWQRAISITGTYGYQQDEDSVGTCIEVMDASETGLDGSGNPGIGVGSVIRLDTERMFVTEKSWVASGQTVLTPLTASAANVTIAVTDGTQFVSGETLLVDSERVLVTDVAGNNLTVDRARNGSVLASHSGSALYWPRTLTVQRGALGTTAASHLTNAPMYVLRIPSLIVEYTLALAEMYMLQRQSGWARAVGPDTNARTGPKLIRELEDAVYSAYGRKVRLRAV